MDIEIDFSAIGKRIRDVRKSRNLSIVEAAKATGISTGVISALELARRNIGLRSLMTFAQAYNCSIDELVFGQKQERTEDHSSIPTEKIETTDEVFEDRQPIVDNQGLSGMQTSEPVDYYMKSFQMLLESCDPEEKEYLYRMCVMSHNELKIMNNRIQFTNMAVER